MSRTTEFRRIDATALSIGVATGAYALSFGAISIASGLDFWQTQSLSLLMFTGASQFAFVGVIGAGGGAVVAIVTALLLGARNSLYALSIAPRIQVSKPLAPIAAMLTIDESTAMAIRFDRNRRQTRRAFFMTGLSVYVLWNIGTALGALGAGFLSDPGILGLDAAIPAGFLALLWPRLQSSSSSERRLLWLIAVSSGGLALILVPIFQPGIPVLMSALVAVAASIMMKHPDSIESP